MFSPSCRCAVSWFFLERSRRSTCVGAHRSSCSMKRCRKARSLVWLRSDPDKEEPAPGSLRNRHSGDCAQALAAGGRSRHRAGARSAPLRPSQDYFDRSIHSRRGYSARVDQAGALQGMGGGVSESARFGRATPRSHPGRTRPIKRPGEKHRGPGTTGRFPRAQSEHRCAAETGAPGRA